MINGQGQVLYVTNAYAGLYEADVSYEAILGPDHQTTQGVLKLFESGEPPQPPADDASAGGTQWELEPRRSVTTSRTRQVLTDRDRTVVFHLNSSGSVRGDLTGQLTEETTQIYPLAK